MKICEIYVTTKVVIKMYIYNPIEETQPEHLILNPDLLSHTSFDDENLNIFFRNLELSKNVNKIISIYIEFEIIPILFEKQPQLYKKQSYKIQDFICQFFQYDTLNLFYNGQNYFYIVTCDMTNKELEDSFLSLFHTLTKKKVTYHQKEFSLHISCGIYSSYNLKICPVDFFNNARRQFFNTQLHNQTFFSILDGFFD